MSRLFLPFASLIVASLACGQAASAEKPVPATMDQGQFDAMMKAWVESHPDVVFNAVNGYVANLKAQQQRDKDDLVVQATPDLLNADGGAAIGTAAPKVTMIYFLDAACSYCRRSTAMIDALLSRNPDLRIVERFVSFLTPSSDYAARVALLVSRRFTVQYPVFYKALMSRTEALSVDLVDRTVVDVLGKDALASVKADATEPVNNAFEAGVQSNMQLSTRIKVDGTPFFYVAGAGQDGIVRGATSATRLQAAFDKVRGASAASGQP